VRKATDEEAGDLANVLALALFDDPPNLWAFPDVKRRREILPAFFHVFVEASLRQREAYTVEDLSAVCLWFLPGWDMSEDEASAFEGAIRTAAAEYAESGPLTILGLMGRHHPTEPHFYLAFAGTIPDRQGRGIGSTLIKRVLDRCDDEHIPRTSRLVPIAIILGHSPTMVAVPLRTTPLAFSFSQHPDEHRPQRPILLAIDQQLRERPRRRVPPVGANRVGPVEVGQHEDVEKLARERGQARPDGLVAASRAPRDPRWETT
jgi:GNAT superfamily N-acetyltransferase